MPQPTVVLSELSSGYAPIATGIPSSRFLPYQGLPGTGGPLGNLAGMALTPQMYQAYGAAGMIPTGLGHDQNVYDQLMKQQFNQAQMRAMQLAAESDRQAFMQSFRGMAALTGTPYGAEQRRAASALSNLAVQAAPMMAEAMPDFLDQMGGSRGSATVMARRMIDAGRYRADPVTGRMGMSADTVGAISRNLYSDLYSTENLASMRGVTAGQAGALFEQLQMRGMVGAAGGDARFMGYRADDPRAMTLRAADDMARTSPADLRRAASSAGVDMSKGIDKLSASDIDKLTLDPQIADKMRSFDAARIKKAIQNYTGVVSAMRDIFGDLGRPNAPMQELIAAVEAMSGGSMAQIDPGRLSTMVRQTHNLAKQTGVTLDNAMIMQQNAAARGQALGLEPVFAVQATQGALAFGGAYRAQGHAAHTAWGAMNVDQLQQMDIGLRQQAAASSTANRMAAAVRMSEASGGFRKGSDAASYVEAVRGGMNQWQDASGRLRSVVTSDADFVRMMTSGGAGLSEGDVVSMLGQRSTNREYTERLGVADVVRRAQGSDELIPFVGHRLQDTLAVRLRDQMIRGGTSAGEASTRARQAAAAISSGAARKIFDLSTEEFADTQRRNAGIGGIIGGELEAAGFGDVLAGMSDDQKEQFLSQTADRFYGASNRALQSSQYRAFGNMQNVHRLNNRTTLDETDRQQMQARFRGQMQEAMSPLGHGTALSRAVDALRDLRPGDKDGMLKVVAGALGGVKTADINRALMPEIQKVSQKRAELEALQNRFANTSDPVERRKLQEQIDVARRELTAQNKSLAGLGEQFGLFTEEALGAEDVGRAMGSSGELLTAQNDLAGLRGGFGAQVTTDDINDIKKRSGTPGTKGEATAVIVARQSSAVDAIANLVMSGEAAKLNDAQKASLEGEVAKVRQHYPGVSDARATAMALQSMKAGAARVKDDDLDREMASLNITSDDEARGLIRMQRRSTPARASEAEVAEQLRQHPGMTEEQARDVVNSRLRARRLGVSRDEVERIKQKRGFEGPLADIDAIAEAFGERAFKRQVVTPEDRQTFLDANKDYPSPTDDQVKRFRESNKDFQGDDAAVKDEILNRVILTRRRRAQDSRMAEFWASDEGAAFRETADLAGQDVENVAFKLVQSPAMVQRLGTRAVDYSKELRTGQQRLRELALFHTKGDLPKLLLGNYDADTNPEAAEKARAEVRNIQLRQRSIMAQLQEQQGLSGRQFRMGDDTDATRWVLDREVAAGRMTREYANAALDADLSPAQRMAVRRRAAELGSEDKAREVLGIDAGRELTDWERAKVSAVQFGAGVEEEVVGLVGRLNWDKMSPEERAKVVEGARKGVGSRQAALALLRDEHGMTFADIAARRGLTEEEEERTNSLAVGLFSDAHARQLAGYDQGVALSDRQQQQVKGLRTGLATEAWARDRMGLPADPLSPTLRQKVEGRRRAVGDVEEARRLLGLKPGARSLTEEENARVAALMKGTRGFADPAGAARKMLGIDPALGPPDDEEAERIRLVTMGLASRERAAELLGEGFAERLKNQGYDGLTKDQQAAIDAKVKELEADPAAAHRMMGLRPGEVLSPADEVRMTQMTKDVGIVRRLSTQQEAAVTRHFDRQEKMKAAQSRKDHFGYNRLLKEGAADARAVGAIASDLGLSVEDLAGVTTVRKRLAEAQKQAAARQNEDATETVRGILTEYGLKVGEEPSPTQKQVAGLMAGTTGRETGQRILETARTLRSVASRRADGKSGREGVEAMSREYLDIMDLKDPEERKKKLREFQKSYKFETDDRGMLAVTGPREWEDFRQSIQFQQQTGFLGFRKEGDLLRLYNAAMQGGAVRDKDAEKGPQSAMPDKMEMTGYVTLVGDKLDMSGATASGSRSYTPGVV
jgi:hypothetical protein